MIMAAPAAPAGFQMPPEDHVNGIRMGPFDRSFNFMEEGDKDWFMYNPSNAVEQQQVASHFFQSMAFPRQYQRKMANAIHIIQESMLGGRRGADGRHEFKEALGEDDFNYIMQDILYRKLLEGWDVPETPFEQMSMEIKPPTPKRPGKLFTFDGLTRPFGRVNPGEVPDLRYPYDSGIAITVAKYMADVEILFETFLEDDLNALGRIPDALRMAVRATKGRLYTGLYANRTGWRRSNVGDPFFVTNNDKILNPELSTTNPRGIGNVMTANPQFGIAANAEFSIPAVQSLMTQISLFLSPDGNPTDISAMYLLHGYALREIVQNNYQMASTVSERAGGLQAGAGAGQGLFRLNSSRNVLSGITPVVDPYLHVVADQNGAGGRPAHTTMWGLFASPSAGRPLWLHAKLAGYEKPVLMRRIPQYRGIGGSMGAGVGAETNWHSTGFRVGFFQGEQWADARGGGVTSGQG